MTQFFDMLDEPNQPNRSVSLGKRAQFNAPPQQIKIKKTNKNVLHGSKNANRPTSTSTGAVTVPHAREKVNDFMDIEDVFNIIHSCEGVPEKIDEKFLTKVKEYDTNTDNQTTIMRANTTIARTNSVAGVRANVATPAKVIEKVVSVPVPALAITPPIVAGPPAIDPNVLKEYYCKAKKILEDNNILISTITLDCKLHTLIHADDFSKYIELKMDQIVSVQFGDRNSPATNRTIVAIKKKKKASKKNFYNQVTILMKPTNNPNRNYINIKVFQNGSLQMTGCKNMEDFNNVTNTLIKILKEGANVADDTDADGGKNKKMKHINFISDMNNIGIYDVKIRMINSNFKLDYKIDRRSLDRILRAKHGKKSRDRNIGYVEFKYEPTGGHSCVNIKYRYDDVSKPSIFVFQTGAIIITGAKNLDQIIMSYYYITKILNKYRNFIQIVEIKRKDYRTALKDYYKSNANNTPNENIMAVEHNNRSGVTRKGKSNGDGAVRKRITKKEKIAKKERIAKKEQIIKETKNLLDVVIPVVVAKGKPGRPRKVINPNQPEKIKRKVGRPRKMPLIEADTDATLALEVEMPAPTLALIAKPALALAAVPIPARAAVPVPVPARAPVRAAVPVPVRAAARAPVRTFAPTPDVTKRTNKNADPQIKNKALLGDLYSGDSLLLRQLRDANIKALENKQRKKALVSASASAGK